MSNYTVHIAADGITYPCPRISWSLRKWHLVSGGCFTNTCGALQILSWNVCVCCRNRTSYENFELKLGTCAQNHALGTVSAWNSHLYVISGIVHFHEIILESSRDVSETTPWSQYRIDTTAWVAVTRMCCVARYSADAISSYVSVTSNGSWCMGIKGEMSGTVCVTFTWYMYIYMSCL